MNTEGGHTYSETRFLSTPDESATTYLIYPNPASGLLNIEINEKTIPYIFDRMRDVDPSIHRSIYTKSAEEIADFRVLSIET